MASIEQNLNHDQEALDRFLEQFKNKPALAALVSALVAPFQDVENALWSLYTGRWIDTAEGAALDNIGDIVQQPREGRADGTYKNWIQARIIINRTNGQGDDVLRVAELVIGSLDLVEFREFYPAAYVVRVTELGPDAQVIFDILSKVKPAGVRFNFIYTSRVAGVLFTFTPGPTIVSAPFTGFGAGKFVGALGTE